MRQAQTNQLKVETDKFFSITNRKIRLIEEFINTLHFKNLKVVAAKIKPLQPIIVVQSMRLPRSQN